MSYLFSIDEKQKVVLHPEVVKLCPSFRALKDNEVLYVVLAYDYSSIYKQFPENERKRKSMWHAFNENEAELIESPRIMAAATDYISLQYNPKIETIRAYEKKIDKMLTDLKDEASPTQIEKIDKAIATLRKRINEMNSEVFENTLDDGVLKGGRVRSLLERLMANQKEYFAVIDKKV